MKKIYVCNVVDNLEEGLELPMMAFTKNESVSDDLTYNVNDGSCYGDDISEHLPLPSMKWGEDGEN